MTDKTTARKRKAVDTVALNIDLPKPIRERLDAQTARTGRSITKEVVFALEKWLDDQEKSAAKKGGGRL
jgi:predicted DNA-binding protein